MVEKNIGALIASRRKKNNMTQSELAARLGISDKAVSKWERGLSKPSMELMPQVVEILGLPGFDDKKDLQEEHRKNSCLQVICEDGLRIVSVGCSIGFLCCFFLGVLNIEQTVISSLFAMLLFGFATLLKSK